MVKYVFCFGTLKHPRVWREVTGQPPEVVSATAELRGWVVEVGPWGFLETHSTGNQEDLVVGMVRPVRDCMTWIALDYFESVHAENPRYERREVDVLVNGEMERAIVYARKEGLG